MAAFRRRPALARLHPSVRRRSPRRTRHRIAAPRLRRLPRAVRRPRRPRVRRTLPAQRLPRLRCGPRRSPGDRRGRGVLLLHGLGRFGLGALAFVIGPAGFLAARTAVLRQIPPAVDVGEIAASGQRPQLEQVEGLGEVRTLHEAFQLEAPLALGQEARLHADDPLQAAGVAARQAQVLADGAEHLLRHRRAAAFGAAAAQRRHRRQEQGAQQHGARQHAAVLDAMVHRLQHAPELDPLRLRRAAEEVGQRRHQDLQCADVAQQLEALQRMATAQQAQDLLQQARRRRARQVRSAGGHRRQRVRFDVEAEPAGELRRAQDAHRVLAEAHARIADGADRPRAQVRQAAGIVEDAVADRIEEQRIDREVAPQCVLLGVAELVVARDQQVVRAVHLRRAPERGHFEDLGVAVEVQVRQFEPAADDAAVVRERALDLLRPRARRHVVVLGQASEQQVADAAADQVCLVTACGEPLRGAYGIRVQGAQVDAGRRKDRGLDRRRSLPVAEEEDAGSSIVRRGRSPAADA
jgi:hypothetical protein